KIGGVVAVTGEHIGVASERGEIRPHEHFELRTAHARTSRRLPIRTSAASRYANIQDHNRNPRHTPGGVRRGPGNGRLDVDLDVPGGTGTGRGAQLPVDPEPEHIAHARLTVVLEVDEDGVRAAGADEPGGLVVRADADTGQRAGEGSGAGG